MNVKDFYGYKETIGLIQCTLKRVQRANWSQNSCFVCQVGDDHHVTEPHSIGSHANQQLKYNCEYMY